MKKIKGGERWEVLQPLDAGGITMWKAPFTGGFKCIVPTGAILTVERDPLPHATAVYCIPEDYKGIERLVVPEDDRQASKYDGYALVVPLEAFATELKPAS